MRNDTGFTLAEMLLAMALTLVVVVAALGSFTSAMRISDSARIISETNHSLQAAVSIMVRDFVQAGQGIPSGGIPVPNGENAQVIVRPGPPGAVMTFPVDTAVLPAVAPGASLGPVVLGVQTDVVMLLYADPTLRLNQYPLAAVATDGSSMTVSAQTPITGPDGLKVGDLILFSNAQGNALQMITRVEGTQTVYFDAGDALRLNQRNAGQGTVLELRADSGTFPPTTATRVVMVSYYVDAVTEPSEPRLVRQISHGARLAIAMGIENLQFTFDIVDGELNPTNVAEPPPANSPHQIRKVNLFLAGRSLDLSPHTGQHVRNSMATEVALRSLSFVDRYR